MLLQDLSCQPDATFPTPLWVRLTRLSGEDNVDSVWNREEKTLKVTGAPYNLPFRGGFVPSLIPPSLLYTLGTEPAWEGPNDSRQYSAFRGSDKVGMGSAQSAPAGKGTGRDDGVRLICMRAATVGDLNL